MKSTVLKKAPTPRAKIDVLDISVFDNGMCKSILLESPKKIKKSYSKFTPTT